MMSGTRFASPPSPSSQAMNRMPRSLQARDAVMRATTLREPRAGLIDRTVMAVMAEAGRDPDELRGRTREIGIQGLEGDDVRRACAAVVGERVVLERVGVRAPHAPAGRRHTFHVGAP